MNVVPPSECYSINMKEPFPAACLNVLFIALPAEDLKKVSLVKNSVKLNFLTQHFFLAFYRTNLELLFQAT